MRKQKERERDNSKERMAENSRAWMKYRNTQI